MRIAVNARHQLKGRLEGVGVVTEEVLRRIAHAHSDDHLDCYFDRPYDPEFIYGPNVHGFHLMPPTRLPVLVRYWLNKRVAPHVSRRKANVFFSPDGFIPLGMRTPKVSMVHDVAFLRYPEFLQPRIRRFYATWMPRYLAYTDHIITVSEFSKKELIAGYNLPPEKISVIYNGVTDTCKPVTEDVKVKVRKSYTYDKPYFIYLGSIHPRKNILTLVRAFEQCKAAVASDHQLVLVGRFSWHSKEVRDAIQQSPYRTSIHMPGYVPATETPLLLASAEALVYPSLYEGFGLPLVEAMACGVPVITSHVSALPEVAGNAALFFDPSDASQLSGQMERIIADDSLRTEMISLGHARSQHFSWDRAAEEVYEVLVKFAK